MLVCMGLKRILSRGGVIVDFSNSFSKGGPKVVKFVFYQAKLRKQHFLLKFSNSCPPSNIHVYSYRGANTFMVFLCEIYCMGL